MTLYEIAHARTGDKGDTANIVLAVYDMKDYPLLAREVTAEKVKHFFREMVTGEVMRYEVPQLGALNFVLQGTLAGGVTKSLPLDIHGKSLSCALLSMELS
jgi:hypothetical protein